MICWSLCSKDVYVVEHFVLEYWICTWVSFVVPNRTKTWHVHVL